MLGLKPSGGVGLSSEQKSTHSSSLTSPALLTLSKEAVYCLCKVGHFQPLLLSNLPPANNITDRACSSSILSFNSQTGEFAFPGILRIRNDCPLGYPVLEYNIISGNAPQDKSRWPPIFCWNWKSVSSSPTFCSWLWSVDRVIRSRATIPPSGGHHPKIGGLPAGQIRFVVAFSLL